MSITMIPQDISPCIGLPFSSHFDVIMAARWLGFDLTGDDIALVEVAPIRLNEPAAAADLINPRLDMFVFFMVVKFTPLSAP